MATNRLNYVNFNQLRSFFAVARELSFTKAADLLCIGQPTVSTQVKTLEETYNLKLFLRGPGELALTEAGNALFVLARQIFALEERAHALLQTVGNEFAGHLHIGTVGPYFVMNLLSTYIDRYPLMRVSLESASSNVIYEKLLNYEIDIGILGNDYDDPRLDLVSLGEHEVVVVVPSKHPWACRDAIEIEELDGQRMIFREPGSMTRVALERALGTRNVRPNIVMELARDSVLEATAAGLGLGIASRSETKADSRLALLSVAGLRPTTKSFCGCLKERRSILPISSFMQMSEEAELRSG